MPSMKFVENVIEEYNPDISGENYLEFNQCVDLKNRGGLVALRSYGLWHRDNKYYKVVIVNIQKRSKNENERLV